MSYELNRLDAKLPDGTVTFLMTDVENSTETWERVREGMRLAILKHDQLAEDIIRLNAGILLKHRGEGDSLFAVFSKAEDALAAAVAMQIAFHGETWPEGIQIRVRMALHTGVADLRDGDYYGPAVNRCARLRGFAHGGQTVLSGTAARLVREELPSGVTLLDLGEHKLKNLQHPEHVFQVGHPDLPDDFPPVRSANRPSSNLPIQLTHFVGRTQEQADVRRLLLSSRLLTLVGVGGIGKTRLAVEVSSNTLEEFADGAWFVDLSRITEPALVPFAIADALNLKESAQAAVEETLVSSLREKSVLLVLDNCEHLIAACGFIVDRLLKACPGLRVLATSRVALEIAGETVWSMSPLSYPDASQVAGSDLVEIAQNEAVRLFIDRARNISPKFALTEKNLSSVVSICRRVGGLPLAIELAAARVHVMQPADIDKRLFDLLENNSAVAQGRHRSLQALMEWSFDSLLPDERGLFMRLAVFTGTWSLEAAEAVCSGYGIAQRKVMKLLHNLVRGSLVVTVTDERELTMRYRLLEVVHVFAMEQLTDSDEEQVWRQAHCEYFLGLAEEAAGYLDGPQQAQYLERLEVDHSNLRAAMSWTLDPDIRLRFAASLWRFWHARSHLSEGRGWLENALARSSDTTNVLRAQALNGLGILSTSQSDYAKAQVYIEEAEELFRIHGDERGIAEAQTNLGSIFLECGDQVRAMNCFDQSLTIWEQTNNRRGIASASNNIGMILRSQNKYADAEKYFLRGLQLYQELEDGFRIGIMYNNLGGIAYELGRYEEARDKFRSSLNSFQAINNRHISAILLYNLGELETKIGSLDAALPLFVESLRLRRAMGDRSGCALVIGSIASAAFHCNHNVEAVRLYAAADLIHRETGKAYPELERQDYEIRLTTLRTRLGASIFSAEWEAGALLTFDQAADYALSQQV